MGGPEERTLAGGGERTEWRDWAADLPEDPRERLAALERKCIEMGAVLDVLKAPGPGSLSRREKAAAAEEGLVPARTRASRPARYDSYRGEPDRRPGNLTLGPGGARRFRAEKPFSLLVTDVTMFSLGGFRCYLSPAIDCFDGDPVAWRISRRPDDDLTDGTLRDAMAKAGPGAVVHTDGGGNYISDRWVADCEALGAVRSMSRKGRSPDNARAEGFFGTLKQEFFYARDWTGVGYEEFAAELDAYIVWYRDRKLKKALGWKAIREHREEMGVAV